MKTIGCLVGWACIALTSPALACGPDGFGEGVFQYPVNPDPADQELDRKGFVFRKLLGGAGHYKFHAGLDISGDASTSIYPTARGKVHQILEPNESHDFGTTVILDHGVVAGFDSDGDGADDRLYSLYAHLSSVSVAAQNAASAEEDADKCIEPSVSLGMMGETGEATAVHLHFEIKTKPGVDGTQGTDSYGFGSTPDLPTGYAYVDPALLINPYSQGTEDVTEFDTPQIWRVTGALGAWVRTGPGQQYRRISDLGTGVRVAARASRIGWLRIDLPHSRRPLEGWVSIFDKSTRLLVQEQAGRVFTVAEQSSLTDATGRSQLAARAPVKDHADTLGTCTDSVFVWPGQTLVVEGGENDRSKLSLPVNNYVFHDSCHALDSVGGQKAAYVENTAGVVESIKPAEVEPVHDEIVRWLELLANEPLRDYLPATTVWTPILRFRRAEYDNYFAAAQDARDLAADELRLALHSVEQGRASAASGHLERAKRTYFRSLEHNQVAIGIWLHNITLTKHVTRGVYDGSRQAVVFGAGFVGRWSGVPKLELLVEGAFLPLDFAVAKAMGGEDAAIQAVEERIFADVLAKVLLKEVPLPGSGSSIEDVFMGAIEHEVGVSSVYRLINEVLGKPEVSGEVTQALAIVLSTASNEVVQRIAAKLLAGAQEAVDELIAAAAPPRPSADLQRSSADVSTLLAGVAFSFAETVDVQDIQSLALVDVSGSHLPLTTMILGKELEIAFDAPLQQGETYRFKGLPQWDYDRLDWTLSTEVTALQTGTHVVVNNTGGVGLNLRDAPGLGGNVVGRLEEEHPLTIAEGPVVLDGFTWWEVTDGVDQGWAATGDWLANPTGGGLQVGVPVVVQDTGGTGLNLRAEPGISAGVITLMADGTDLEVIGGPVRSDGYLWWLLRSSSETGWAATAPWLFPDLGPAEAEPSVSPVIDAVFPGTLSARPLPETQMLTITGSGLAPSSMLRFDDGIALYERRPEYIDAGTLTYDIAVGPDAGSWTVSVVNGEAVSDPVLFTVTSESNTDIDRSRVIAGAISEPGDTDEWTFTANAGEAVHVRVIDQENSDFRPKVSLFAPDGTLVQSDAAARVAALNCRSTSTHCSLDQTGVYRLLIGDDGDNDTGGYEIQFAPIPESNEHGGLVPDGIVSGEITIGDIDTYVFDAAADDAVHIRVVDMTGSGFTPRVYLYKPDGTLVLWDDDASVVALDCRQSSNSCQLDQTGTYRVVVVDHSNTGVGSYDIRFVHVPQTNRSGALVHDGTVSGALPVGGIDSFVFTAAAGEALHIRVVDRSLDSSSANFTPEVYLYNPDGTLNGVSVNGTVVTFDCRATSSSCQLNQTGTYRLVVVDDGDDYAGSYDIHLSRVLQTNRSGSLVHDGTVSGALPVGGIDSFVFTAAAGEALHIRVVDKSLDSSSFNFTPEVYLYNPDGTLNRVGEDRVAVAFDCRTGSSNCQLNQTGTYRLVVVDDGDDYAGSYDIHLSRVLQTNRSGALVNDGTVSGALPVGGIDSFVFTAAAGEALHIRVVDRSLDSSSANFTPEVYLYNPDGTLNGVSVNGTVVTFDCRATSSSCQLNQTGTYRLVVVDDGDDYAGSYDIHLSRVLQTNRSGSLVHDGTVSGALPVGGIDSFVFTAAAGEALHIRVVDKSLDSSSFNFTPEVYLYNPDGTLNRVGEDRVAVAFDCRTGSSNCQLNQTGTYRLVVVDDGDDYAGSYDIHLSRVLQTNRSGALVNDGTVSGALPVGGIDSFVFTAAAGEALHIRVVDRSLDSSSANFTPEVYLYNPDGTLNGVSVNGTVVTFDCRATSSSCQLNQTGTYRLVVVDDGDDYAGSYDIHLSRVLQTNRSGSLVHDGTVSGALPVGGIDSFVFTAAAGEALHIRVVDKSLDSSSFNFTPEVYLYNPDGTLNRVGEDRVAVAFDCRTGSSNCQLNQTGTYRLVVVDDGDDYAGSYDIHLSRVLQTNRSGALVNDGTVSGALPVGGIDSFVFTAAAGEALHIRVVDRSLDSSSANFTPEVYLYNPDGTLNGVSVNGTVVTFDCRATSSSCQLNQTGTYRLVVVDDGDDYAGSYDIHLSRVLQTNRSGSLVHDGTVSGALPVGGIDSFVFTAAAGEALHIRVVDKSLDSSSFNFTPEVYLYNPDGTLNRVGEDRVAVAFDCRTGSSNCQLNQTGTYRLVVVDDGDDYAGSYDIHLSRVLQTNRSGALVNDGTVSGALPVGGIDSFVFTAAAGEAGRIRLVDTSDTNFSPEAFLYNPDGTLLAVASRSDVVEFDCHPASSVCQLTHSGIYRLVVVDDGDDYAGRYEVSLTGLPQYAGDSDGDGVFDDSDNCPEVANSDQANFDGDAQGDACDVDDDNDGLSDVEEAQLGTDPLDRDSDNDSLSDGEEVQMGLDPLDGSDCPEDICPTGSSFILRIIPALMMVKDAADPVTFVWPVDPTNSTSGHDGACGDWPGESAGCFWLSGASEDAVDTWRDVQPFQRHLNTDFNGYHVGADYNLGSGNFDEGRDVYPAASGVINAGAVLENVCGWGNVVFVEHVTPEGPITTMYAHLEWQESGPPTPGPVDSDTAIAVVGNGQWSCESGSGQYPFHLHFEVRKGRSMVPGSGYTNGRLPSGQLGPQGQVDPNSYLVTH